MSEAEREKFYDDEIAPALLALAKRCKEAGLSFLAVVEWAPGEQGRTCSLRAGSGFGIRLAEAAAKSGGNVDNLIGAIETYARQHGHSSIYLRCLGVPLEPAPAA